MDMMAKKERPMLMSAPMVRAILAGTKTQTRRVMANHPGDAWTHDGFGRITSKHPKQGRFGLFVRRGLNTDFPECDIVPCPYGQPGDRLWVRESTEADYDTYDAVVLARYCADKATVMYTDEDDGEPIQAAAHWDYPRDVRPSIHMKREQARITLEITRVRVERLQDISAEDAMAEGVIECSPHLHGLGPCMEWRYAFEDLWESINGPGSWDANPWVWVVEFKRIA